MAEFQLRPIQDDDQHEVAELIYGSINVWYQTHGRPAIFRGGPRVAEIYYQVYNELTPGCSVAAVHSQTGRIMGCCFYHPRKHHVGLGIMAVHPNHFGTGVGTALLKHIIDYTDSHGYKALRLTQSAINVDSFSLYNKAGFVPRCAYQDMLIEVPTAGFDTKVPGIDRVRTATTGDVSAMSELEMQVSGIERTPDYEYCIKNELEIWNTLVSESPSGQIDGFVITSHHPASQFIGPCVAATEQAALALIMQGLDLFAGGAAVVLVPMDKQLLVRGIYELGGRNCEMHFCQVRGEFQAFEGVSMPSFLPETG